MTTKNKNGSPFRPIVIPIFAAVVSGAFVQVAGGLIYGGKIISHLEQLDKQQSDQDKVVERLDARGTQQLPIINQRLSSLEETVRHNTTRIDVIQSNTNTISPIMQVQLDAIKSNLTRIEEVAKRVGENLDELYRQLSLPKRKQ